MPRSPRTSPYWPVVSHPLLRRVLPGLAVSALGDGMAVVAVTWLAIQLAPTGQRGLWIAVAVAAYTLPSAVGTVAFGRLLRGRGGAQLAGWDAILRAAALAAIPIAHLTGTLTIGLYVALLAASALLHSWGSAGRFTLIAELLPPRHHLPANAVPTTISGFATVVGPPLAGILIGWVGPVWVIAVDAATFAVLALTYRLALPTTRTIPGYERSASRTAGFAFIRRQPTLLGLLVLSVAFFFLFGPVYVAMPLHITDDLRGSATLLGAYYTAFGVGGLLGGVLAGHLRHWPLQPTIIGIVIGFGAAMLPLGLGAPVVLSLPAFALAGLIWAPYMSTSMALFQRSVSTEQLPAVLAANSAVLVLAVPLGTMLGGPLAGAIGPRPTLLLCGTAILALGLAAAGLAMLRRSAGGPVGVPRRSSSRPCHSHGEREAEADQHRRGGARREDPPAPRPHSPGVVPERHALAADPAAQPPGGEEQQRPDHGGTERTDQAGGQRLANGSVGGQPVGVRGTSFLAEDGGNLACQHEATQRYRGEPRLPHRRGVDPCRVRSEEEDEQPEWQPTQHDDQRQPCPGHDIDQHDHQVVTDEVAGTEDREPQHQVGEAEPS
ncbi:MFS transporter [Micromonospora sp. NPDC005979]|uniref:MFS transporter n=1 Tax=Micromonospora sp. NPDC005979 TaxID=3156726 RepID=UPI0033B08966